MSKFKSNQTVINPKTNKPVPIWKLDTNTMTVTHFSPDTLTAEHKTYCTDFIRYHVHYSENHCPDRLRKLVNDGSIISYLDDLETRVNDALNRQVQLWKESDREYQTAVAVGDTDKQNGLENCFYYMARESVFECMVYV
ncbi:MAG: hypothetical protein PUB89_07810 [Oscillospiraceae bacterium]|nr:hypothetical protein [Oscillospiraceae bacterium]